MVLTFLSISSGRRIWLPGLAAPVLALLLLASTSLNAQDRNLIPPVVASVDADDLAGFSDSPETIRSVLQSALTLTRRKLGYLYGSADPSAGGMDCSGTVWFLLQKAGIHDVPRSSSEQYTWVKEAGKLRAVDATSLESPQFDALRPGDLLFWSGTYDVQRANGITHAMIYLGRAKSDGSMLMVGASDGRSYRGKRCFGVSVFDFRLPSAGSKSRFVGYGPIPGLAGN